MGIKKKPPRTGFEKHLRERYGSRYITAADLEYNRELLRHRRMLEAAWWHPLLMTLATPLVRLGRILGWC